MTSRSKPIRQVYTVGALVNGRRRYAVVRATSEASARIQGAHQLSEKYNAVITSFNVTVEV